MDHGAAEKRPGAGTDLLLQAFADAPVALFEFDASGVVVAVDELGGGGAAFEPARLRGRPLREIAPENRMLAEQIVQVLAGRRSGGIVRLDDTPFLVCCWPRQDVASAAIDGGFALVMDAAPVTRVEEELSLAAAVFDATSEGVVVAAADTRILRVNAAFTEITGYDASEAIGKTTALLKSGRHGAGFYRDMWAAIESKGRWEGEVWNRRKNGSIYPEWLSIVAIRGGDGKVVRYVGVFMDIAKRKEAEERLRYQADYDGLTGLPNRRLLDDRLVGALERARGAGRLVGLLNVDIDNFKYINDSLGHVAGDQILVEVGRRIAAIIAPGDTVARYGDDEFMVLMAEISDPADISLRAEALMQAVASPAEIEGRADPIVVTSCVGVAVFPADGETVADLIRAADTARFFAKRTGPNAYQFFHDEMNVRATERLELENRLRRALDLDHFHLHYQPKVDLRTGRISGAEALIRWDDPDRGMVLPDRFIPVAEETGLIVPLGEWVLEEACREAKRLGDLGLLSARLAVNLSARQFHLEDLVERVRRILDATGLSPNAIEFEITESAIMHNAREAAAKMTTLAEMGISLAIDDFGTGYSSLGYLKDFPIRSLKIDRSFIDDIHENGTGGKLAAAVIGIGQSMNLKVVAEGVERPAQIAFLRQQWCDEMQGFIFSRPIPGDQFEALLRSGRHL